MISVARLASLAAFRDVPAEVVATLAPRAIPARYSSGAVLFLAGSKPRGWYIVLEGRVRVVRGSGARQHVIHTESAGGTLGEVPLFAGGTHPATGIAAEPTTCALFTRDALKTAIATNPAVAFLLLERLAGRVRTLVDRLDERSAHSVRARLAEYLMTRQALSGTSTISIGLTQQQLAEELGTVREVVSREIRALCRTGLVVSKGGGRYLLAGIDRLRSVGR